MRAAGHTTTERSATSGTIVSAPTSVSFCTTHSGRSPLTGAKTTVIAGSAAGDEGDLSRGFERISEPRRRATGPRRPRR